MRQVLNDSQGVKSSDGSITVFAEESPTSLFQAAITFPIFRFSNYGNLDAIPLHFMAVFAEVESLL